MDNNLNILGIAKKAGKLEIGEENVAKAARRGKAKLILSASDASPRSLRHALDYGEQHGVTSLLLPYSKAELGSVLGRGLPGIAALTDTGFAALIARRLAQTDPERYGEIARRLTESNARLLSRKSGKNPVKATNRRTTI